MNHTLEYILSLLAARLCGEKLTSEEEKLLGEWRQNSPDNEKLFRYYENIFARKTDLQLWEQVQCTSAKRERFFRSSRTFRRRLLTFARYAAIVVPVVVASCWLWLRQAPQQVPVPELALQQKDIAPGKQKAQLKLENGEVVTLSDSCLAIASHEDIQVGEGGVIRYSALQGATEVKAVYHTLTVERGGEFQLVLPDGTKVWLNSDSELKYPNIFKEEKRQVYLRGEAYFEVKHDDLHPFIVHAGECDIRVLGTAFNVSSYTGDKEIVTTLVKGRVAYTAAGQQGELLPGEQCVFAKDTKIPVVQKVNVDQYVCWKNGLFLFDGITMEELAKQIARWYDVEVIFPDQPAREVRFTGAMERYKPVSYIIRLLNETNTVECRLEGKLLVFRKK